MSWGWLRVVGKLLAPIAGEALKTWIDKKTAPKTTP